VRTPEEFGVVPETSEEKVRGGETVEAFERPNHSAPIVQRLLWGLKVLINASEDGAHYTLDKPRT
jgi:hypothetical protein